MNLKVVKMGLPHGKIVLIHLKSDQSVRYGVGKGDDVAIWQ